MRSDKLGYNAPIEVYEHKYYRYADKDYSITNMPMSHNDFEMMQEAVDMLRQLEILKYSSNCLTSSEDSRTNWQFREIKENQL